MKGLLAPRQYVSAWDPKGIKFLSIVQDAYNKANLTEREAQRVNESRGLSKIIDVYIDKYRAGAECHQHSSSTDIHPIEDKINKLALILGINPISALHVAQSLPDLNTFVPGGVLSSTEWYAFPSYDALAIRYFNHIHDESVRYCSAVAYLMQVLSKKMETTLKGKDFICPANLRRAHHTHEEVKKLWEMQGKGDIILVPMQLGAYFRGQSVEDATVLFAKGEYGACSLMGLSAVLTSHQKLGDISFTMPGDHSHDSLQRFPFGSVPYLTLGNRRLVYGHYEIDNPKISIGAATFFMPS